METDELPSEGDPGVTIVTQEQPATPPVIVPSPSPSPTQSEMQATARNEAQAVATQIMEGLRLGQTLEGIRQELSTVAERLGAVSGNQAETNSLMNAIATGLTEPINEEPSSEPERLQEQVQKTKRGLFDLFR